MNLKEALESAPVQSYIRDMVDERVTETVGAQVSAIRAQEVKRMKDVEAQQRQLDHLRGPRRDGRSVGEVAESMAVLESRRWGGARALERTAAQRAHLELPADAPVCTNGRTRAMRVLEALQEPRDPDGPIRESSGRVLEAAVAAVPVAERGWQELMAMRGVRLDVIEAMGGRAA